MAAEADHRAERAQFRRRGVREAGRLMYETHGGTLLFTGPLGLDEYWRPVRAGAGRFRSRRLGSRQSAARRTAGAGGRFCRSRSAAPRIADSDRGWRRGEGGPAKLTTYSSAPGRLLYCPLPIELNERIEPLRRCTGKHCRWPASRRAGMAARRRIARRIRAQADFRRRLAVRLRLGIRLRAEIEVRDPKTGTSYTFSLAGTDGHVRCRPAASCSAYTGRTKSRSRFDKPAVYRRDMQAANWPV